MKAIIWICYVLILLYAAYKDYREYIVENKVIEGILLLSVFDISRFPFSFLGALLLALPFLYLAVKTDQMGGGDIKFIFANGCFLGFVDNYLGILAGLMLVSALWGFRKIRKKIKKEERIALVPYLVAGYYIVLGLKLTK